MLTLMEAHGPDKNLVHLSFKYAHFTLCGERRYDTRGRVVFANCLACIALERGLA